MTGHSIAEKSYEFTADTSQPAMLEVEGLNIQHALQDINFEVRAGEIVGVTGLLGSGRTELALALFGMLPIDSGRLTMDGKRVGIKSIQDAIAHGIGYVPEDRLTEGPVPGAVHRPQCGRAHHRSAAQRHWASPIPGRSTGR